MSLNASPHRSLTIMIEHGIDPDLNTSQYMPSSTTLQHWANQCAAVIIPHIKQETPIGRYLAQTTTLLVGVQFVSRTHSQALNHRYRQRHYPTNVLSFPYWLTEQQDDLTSVSIPTWGDLACCVSLIEQEAATDYLDLKAHWAHLIIHGLLHLFHYDHQTVEEAEQMETLEIQILAKLGYPNPYGDRPTTP